MRARHCALGLLLFAACGDRSPPALWPEPPPPTLAKPIGIDEPKATEVATSTAGDEGGEDGKSGPTSAGDPAPNGAEPPSTADPLPHGRPPMPPLVP